MEIIDINYYVLHRKNYKAIVKKALVTLFRNYSNVLKIFEITITKNLKTIQRTVRPECLGNHQP